MQSVTLTVDEKGQITVEVNGVRGPACEKLTADLIAALGGNVVSTCKTSDFYQQQQATQQQKGG